MCGFVYSDTENWCMVVWYTQNLRREGSSLTWLLPRVTLRRIFKARCTVSVKLQSLRAATRPEHRHRDQSADTETRAQRRHRDQNADTETRAQTQRPERSADTETRTQTQRPGRRHRDQNADTETSAIVAIVKRLGLIWR